MKDEIIDILYANIELQAMIEQDMEDETDVLIYALLCLEWNKVKDEIAEIIKQIQK